MSRGVTDIVEVVVLAAGAHAFLRGGGALIGALLDAGEDVLELHHAGIGEHQRRVVTRHQRRRRHDLVAVVGKEFEECRPDLVNAAHFGPIAPSPTGGFFEACSRQNVKRFGEIMRPFNDLERGRTQNRIPLLLTTRYRPAFRRGSRRCPESVQGIRGLPHQHKTG